MLEQLTPEWVLIILALYFVMLIGVSWFTSRGADNEGFFLANRNVPWWVVAYGMVGTSISGVTFISIPGKVGTEGANMGFSYMQVVFGYLLGYLFIATVLMPLYYRLNLISIYGYLEKRFGFFSYKTGSSFFILSRTFGSSARMYLAAIVLQSLVFEPLGVPFIATVILMIALVFAYTFKGGLKTIIWTDVIMTTFFLVALVVTVATISNALDLGVFNIIPTVMEGQYGKMFFWDNFGSDPNHFIKQFISGALIAIVMTGLDQDLMQKNLSCKNIGDAQKNMFVFCIYLVIINFLFLILGALLYMYASTYGIDIPERSDQLFPNIAFYNLPSVVGIFFILGLVASAYTSADSALTALTTSFCVDFLGFEKKRTEGLESEMTITEQQAVLEKNETELNKTRSWVHLGFAITVILIILLFNAINNRSTINLILYLAGYTYGPLLGLFMFGLFTPFNLKDKLTPVVCVLAPVFTYILVFVAKEKLNIDVGFLTILINGFITFMGLLMITEWSTAVEREAI